MAITKRPQMTNAGEDVEKREHSSTASGNVNRCSHFGEQYGGSLKKKKTTKNRTTISSSSNSTSGNKIKESENTNSKRYMHPNVHSSIIYNGQDMEAT